MRWYYLWSGPDSRSSRAVNLRHCSDDLQRDASAKNVREAVSAWPINDEGILSIIIILISETPSKILLVLRFVYKNNKFGHNCQQ